MKLLFTNSRRRMAATLWALGLVLSAGLQTAAEVPAPLTFEGLLKLDQAPPALATLQTQAESLPAPVPVASADASAPPTCLQEATGPRNDPSGQRRDFTTLGRCRTVTGWEDPRGRDPVKQWKVDMCIGRYTDPADGKRVYMVWGEAEGRYDERSGFSLPVPHISAAEGTFEKTDPDGTSLRLTAEENAEAITLRKTVDFPSANMDPNKDHNDQDGLVRFSNTALEMQVEMRWRSNYPFSVGHSWSSPLKLSLSCEKES